jgi:Recombination endonuclease VII
MTRCQTCRMPAKSRTCPPCHIRFALEALTEANDINAYRWWKHREHELCKVEQSIYSIRARCAKYDISLADWLYLVAYQKSSCALCSVTLEPLKLCIDHDHISNEVRGLLCTSCNTGLGLLRIDGPIARDRAESVIAYIRQYVIQRSISHQSGRESKTIVDDDVITPAHNA